MPSRIIRSVADFKPKNVQFDEETRQIWLHCEINETVAEEFSRVVNYLDAVCQASELFAWPHHLYYTEDDEKFDEMLTALEARCNRITVRLSSEGGCVEDALTIINNMRACQTLIDIVNDGKAFSCGAEIFVNGTGNRFMFRHSQFMLHNMTYTNSEKNSTLPARMADNQYMKRLHEQFKELFVERSNVSAKQYDLLMEKNVDIYLSAEECLDYGLVDYILN